MTSGAFEEWFKGDVGGAVLASMDLRQPWNLWNQGAVRGQLKASLAA